MTCSAAAPAVTCPFPASKLAPDGDCQQGVNCVAATCCTARTCAADFDCAAAGPYQVCVLNALGVCMCSFVHDLLHVPYAAVFAKCTPPPLKVGFSISVLPVALMILVRIVAHVQEAVLRGKSILKCSFTHVQLKADSAFIACNADGCNLSKCCDTKPKVFCSNANVTCEPKQFKLVGTRQCIPGFNCLAGICCAQQTCQGWNQCDADTKVGLSLACPSVCRGSAYASVFFQNFLTRSLSRTRTSLLIC